MAIQFGTKALIEVGKEVGKVGFGVVTGGGIVLASLLAWTGASDLQSIKDAVNQFEQVAEQQVSYLVGEYEVTGNKYSNTKYLDKTEEVVKLSSSKSDQYISFNDLSIVSSNNLYVNAWVKLGKSFLSLIVICFQYMMIRLDQLVLLEIQCILYLKLGIEENHHKDMLEEMGNNSS